MKNLKYLFLKSFAACLLLSMSCGHLLMADDATTTTTDDSATEPFNYLDYKQDIAALTNMWGNLTPTEQESIEAAAAIIALHYGARAASTDYTAATDAAWQKATSCCTTDASGGGN